MRVVAYRPPARRRVIRRPPMRRRVVVRPPPMRRRAAAGIGYLRIGSKPWTKVYIDGRHYGTTPLLKVKLPAGKHRVVMLNNQAGIRKTIYITIRKGATTTVIRDLRK
jgi:hypothetical protein